MSRSERAGLPSGRGFEMVMIEAERVLRGCEGLVAGVVGDPEVIC